MLFVRRQFEMHKRNSHIIRGTLNSTVTRVPSPFPHPVASVYLFLSLSPSFCLSVCLSLFSTQRRPLERATKELWPLWCETALELEAHVQRLAYIIFQLAFPHFPSLPHTHTHISLCVWEALSKNADRRSSHPAVRTKKVVRVTIQTLFSSCRTEIPF